MALIGRLRPRTERRRRLIEEDMYLLDLSDLQRESNKEAASPQNIQNKNDRDEYTSSARSTAAHRRLAKSDFLTTPIHGDTTYILNPLGMQQYAEEPRKGRSFVLFPSRNIAAASSDVRFVWNYAGVMLGLLLTWLVYLIAPKGFRKTYCRAQRRRYKKSAGVCSSGSTTIPASPAHQHNNVNISFPRIRRSMIQSDNDARSFSSHTNESSLDYDDRSKSLDPRDDPCVSKAPMTTAARVSSSDQRGNQLLQELYHTRQGGNNHQGEAPNGRSARDSSSQYTVNEKTSSRLYPLISRRHSSRLETIDAASSIAGMSSAPPSFQHPAIRSQPSGVVLHETMTRLESRGIRLLAHGVQCEPKRVWIRIPDNGRNNLIWQTEFQKQVTNSLGEQSVVLVRGGIHTIDMSQVVYLDVGKKTTAFIKPESRHLSASSCFSLLTGNGSLDLQASSKLERDALVCCLSKLLDASKGSGEWRRLYQPSPTSSSCFGSQMSVVTDNMMSELHVSYKDTLGDV